MSGLSFIVTERRFSKAREDTIMVKCVRAILILVSLAAIPSIAYAQASIVGTVKDASGAVLPGVTVEASSPALIEKTRSVVTSGTGQYSIEDLRPGTYTVTLYADRVRHGQARRHRADRQLHRDGERGHESGRRGRDDHRHRRSAGRRRDERAHPAGASAARRSPRFRRPASIPPSRSSSRRSTSRATTSAAPTRRSSACSRSTADAGTKDRSWSTA